MRNQLIKLVAMAMLSGGTAYGGSFTNSLSNPDSLTGLTMVGSGTYTDTVTPWQPIVTPEGLILTTNLGSLGAALVVADFDNQQPIESFTAKFQLLLNGAADGVAFAFGPDITDSLGTFGETGPGMSSGGLTVSFDLYVNDPDFIGISSYLMGTEYGPHPMTLSDTAWKDVTIELKRNGSLSMTYGGQTIYNNFALPGYSHVNGQFAFGARTGGAVAIQGVRNLGITTTLKGADTAASITTEPASITVNEKANATFEVGFEGTPPFTFQWAKNGTDIPDATGNSLTLTNVLASENGAKFKCTVANSMKSIVSSEATLTVKSDVVSPAVVSAKGALDLTHVTVVLSKQVTVDSAETVANYAIDNNLTVTAASLSTNDFKTVVLTTGGQKSATTYTITINGIKDTTAAANPIAANTKVTFVSDFMKVVGVGAIKKNGNATYDVGVAYNMPYDADSATKLANYTLSGVTATAITPFAGGYGVVLTVSGLQADTAYTVAVANVKDKVGNLMPAITNSFKVSKMQWGVVGGNESPFGNGVVAVGDNGFDVYSDGVGEWGTYDEATMVYEEITGDFDKKVRVEYQDSSSTWARAGLIARDVTNFGVDRATQEGGACGQYQKVHVNPVFNAMGAAGNNLYEGNRRLATGSATTTALTGANTAPNYPNAWCRLQRKGQTFTIYRSDDGVAWSQLGATTFPDSTDANSKAMPDKLYVGIDYSPENANITDTTLQGVWVARFRDYGDVGAAGQPAELGQTVNGFQDDFTGATRDPNWVAVGPGGDHYVQQDGVLKVFPSAGDPNHLLYMGPGASNTVSEVLARIRVVNFSSGDPARGGIAVNVSTNVPSHLPDWTGVNLNIRNNSEGTPATIVHYKLLDDLRGWGPQTTFGWTNKVWNWMRLRMQSKMDGTNTVFAKIWPADGLTAEPADWQLKWADSALPAPQHGGWPGITGCSGGGVGQFEVSYVLIKSANLPSIKVNFAPNTPALIPPVFTGIAGSTNNATVTINWFGGGKIQSSAAVTGPWTDITNSLPPLSVPLTGAKPAGPQNFYRLQQ